MSRRRPRRHMPGPRKATRVFGGHRFQRRDFFVKKKYANSRANRYRRAGKLARIVKSRRGYWVFTRG